MPFIHVRTARSIPDAARQAMTRTLGRDIRLLGKSEEWLMLQFEGNCALAFRGQEDSDAAFVYVGLLGRADGAQTEQEDGYLRRLGDALGMRPEEYRHLTNDPDMAAMRESPNIARTFCGSASTIRCVSTPPSTR